MKNRILFISLAAVLAITLTVVGCAGGGEEEEEKGRTNFGTRPMVRCNP